MGRTGFMPFLLLAALLGVVALPGEAPGKEGEGFQVIVHPDNTVDELDRGFLRDAYLRKTKKWDSGDTIRPLDLTKKFPAREQFARDVLKKTLAQLKRFWSQQIFSGKDVPPPEVDSEAAVIAYVLRHPGAIGYLPAGADPGRARVVKVK